jgi:hypothetical protein
VKPGDSKCQMYSNPEGVQQLLSSEQNDEECDATKMTKELKFVTKKESFKSFISK